MTRLKRIPAVLWTSLLVVAGFAAVVSGVYLLLGFAVALIVGGVIAAAVGLLVDV